MQSQVTPYPGQFTLAPDLLHIAIPRQEIIFAMNTRGDEQALEDLWLAVAVVADLVGVARRPDCV
jgi:hypothetical protein